MLKPLPSKSECNNTEVKILEQLSGFSLFSSNTELCGAVISTQNDLIKDVNRLCFWVEKSKILYDSSFECMLHI